MRTMPQRRPRRQGRRLDQGGQRHRDEFFPHHGNLAKAEREDFEERLREAKLPTTAVATSTLELGIDLGDVEAIAQFGAGFSVSSLRQRIGRSGRRAGNPAIMRMFIVEEDPTAAVHPVERLRLELIQAIAMVECMIEGWVEPPDPAGLHLSTLLHQTLSLIVQAGAIRAGSAYKVLCERGPFRNVDRDTFAQLLRCMAGAETPLIEMSREGELMLGKGGEQLAYGHEFYAVFETPLDYRILHGSRQLGVLPLDHIVAVGQTLIFGGRRWRAKEVDDRGRVILVEPTNAALPPTFGGDYGGVHDRVVETMRALLAGTNQPPYLDATARSMLADAREAYLELSLDRTSIVPVGRGLYVFPWVGTKRLDTVAVALMANSFEVAAERHRLEIENCAAKGLTDALDEMLAGVMHSPEELSQMVAKPAIAKYDHFLSPELLGKVAMAERLDLPALPGVLARILRPAGEIRIRKHFFRTALESGISTTSSSRSCMLLRRSGTGCSRASALVSPSPPRDASRSVSRRNVFKITARQMSASVGSTRRASSLPAF